MRPFFNKESLWAYPVFAAAGGSFGYWLTGVESRQLKLLAERRSNLLEKRKRKAEREGSAEIGRGGGRAEQLGASSTMGGGGQ